MAISLGKKATEFATHTWTVYLRSPTEQGLGRVIKSVTFKLHESFPNPNRDVTSPPFELRESGWGEFEIVIQIHFHDDIQEPPLELLHHLRLGLDIHGNPQRRPYVYEVYEEIVFWEPTVELYERLQSSRGGREPESSAAQHFGKFDAQAEYEVIQAGRKRIANSVALLKAKVAALEAEEGGLADGTGFAGGS